MRIALVSLDQKWLDKEANFALCERYCQSAAKEACDLVVFPEMTLTGFSPNMPDIAEHAEKSPTLSRFTALAKHCRLNIIFGAALKNNENSMPLNTLCLAKPDRQARSVYAKTHLFSFSGEQKYVDAGNTINTGVVAGATIGFSICYDLRFPELYSVMAADSDAFVAIANWPKKRLHHWRALLVARAIENQCFMIGVNRTGVDGNRLEYDHSSMVISPEGEIVSANYCDDVLEVFDIDMTHTNKYRVEFPTVTDKRQSLYSRYFRID